MQFLPIGWLCVEALDGNYSQGQATDHGWVFNGHVLYSEGGARHGNGR